MILMNLSKVFDTANHEVLIVRLHASKCKIIFLQKLFASRFTESFELKRKVTALCHTKLYTLILF